MRSGGKRGRGAAGKTPFVAAVSTSPEGRPRNLKLAPVKGFRKREIARGAKHWLAPGAAVVTDGLGCWSALDEIACSHQAIRTGSGRQAARIASFKWVNTTLGNIKCAITGTYRKLGRFDDLSATRAGSASTSLAVLSSLMKHAEDLGLRPEESNPCRGLRRRKSGFEAQQF